MAMPGETRKPLTAKRRFDILLRDAFTCGLCGNKPGNDSLQVDHMYPHSLGGSEHEDNLLTLCSKCNNGKSDRILFPSQLGVDSDGFNIYRAWGVWAIKADTEMAGVAGAVYGSHKLTNGDWDYWIGFDRVHEPDWEPHIWQKTWGPPHSNSDFSHALSFARRVVNNA